MKYKQDRYTMKTRILVIMLAVFFIGSSAFGASVSPSQLSMLNTLSDSDRQKLLQAVGGAGSGSALLDRKSATSKNAISKTSTKTTTKTDSLSGIDGEEIARIKALDTIFVHFKEPEQNDISVLLEQRAQNKKKEDLNYEPRSEKVLYKLDKYGVLDLPGLGRIALAGLSEEEAAARLNLEPLLQRFEIELSILPLEPIGKQALKPFGYELFKKPEDGEGIDLQPEMDIPVPRDYVVGPGDVVYIQLYGKENLEYAIPISRDGSLSFPGVGAIPVTGLHFDQLTKELKKRIAKQFIVVSAYITLAELRSIRVFVMGEVEKPGSYLISGAATMSYALLQAEGIKEIGSLRNIALKRNGKLVNTLDLYDLLLKGDANKDVRLQPGDVVHVPPVHKTVSIRGEIRRPAIYEIKGGESVKDILSMSGGVLSTAQSSAIRLERQAGGDVKKIFDVSAVKSNSFSLENGDALYVRPVNDVQIDGVRLTGQVSKEDIHQWKPGLRLNDVIHSIDDLRPNADIDYVIIKRFTPPHFNMHVLSSSLRQAFKNPKGEYNISLQPRDEVVVLDLSEKRTLQIVPIIEQLQTQSESGGPTQVVRINGQVRGPGRYPLEAGMKISDLIRAGGRLKESAYTLEAELTRFNTPDGETREIQHQRVDLAAVLKGDKTADIELKPFDLLNIKEIPLWAEQDKVEIKGEVKFPGTYAIQRGEKLSQLLVRAGGLTTFAYPEGSIFTREDLREREQKRMDEMAASLESEIGLISDQQTRDNTVDTANLEMAQQVLKKLQTTRATGRLVIDLPRIQDIVEKSIEDDSNIDIVLRGGDSLVIPPRMQEVSVIGQVFHPTSHLYKRGQSPMDYVNMSGGMTNRADVDNVYVIRANGAVELAKQNWFMPSTDLTSGDTVVVPLDADKLSNLKLWSSISQIMIDLSTSLAVWNSLGLFD